jgi:hypothetical protein
MGAGGWKRNHLFEIALWKVRAFPHYFIWPKPGKPVHPSRSGSIISGAVQIKNTIDLTEPCYTKRRHCAQILWLWFVPNFQFPISAIIVYNLNQHVWWRGRKRCRAQNRRW